MIDAIKKRRSIRAFLSKDVEEEKLKEREKNKKRMYN
jgi:nitroreductase